MQMISDSLTTAGVAAEMADERIVHNIGKKDEEIGKAGVERIEVCVQPGYDRHRK